MPSSPTQLAPIEPAEEDRVIISDEIGANAEGARGFDEDSITSHLISGDCWFPPIAIMNTMMHRTPRTDVGE